MPITDAAGKLRALTCELTLAQWYSVVITNKSLCSLHLDLKLRFLYGLPRQEVTIICRLWLGEYFTNAYSYLIGMATSPECEIYGCKKTIAHLLCTVKSLQYHAR